ncbi:MAG: hypothetical protein HZC54_06680 [Verrucomicrobia bacterium]|nr:hypothetical protein [Verrucomicrobiota bacterium]
MNLRLAWLILAAVWLPNCQLRGEDIQNSRVVVRLVGNEGMWLGADVIERASGRLIAPLRLSSRDAIFADLATVEKKEAGGVATQTLRFANLRARLGAGVTLGQHDTVSVTLRGEDAYPQVAFDLTVVSFTKEEWERFFGGPTPFHFLTIAMPEAEAWHQRGWLMATPKSDPFVLQQDAAYGGSVASEFSRNWSYVCALGGSPMPAIGLWAPAAKHYAGLVFQGARVTDNSEREVSTAYCWDGGAERQFVALCYPHDLNSYRKVAYPERRSRVASRADLFWSLNLPSTSDPNRSLHDCFQERYTDHAPRVPRTPNVGYMPGATRLNDWPALPPPRLVVRHEKGGTYEMAGTVEIGGWNWYAESPVEAAYLRYDAKAFAGLREDLDYLMAHAKTFEAGGEKCVFWEKPIEGRWKKKWGGEPVRTLHNANGFAAGIAMVDVWRHEHATNGDEAAKLLPFIDGVFNWAKHFVWSRNEFADVPASPFAIGATLPAVFLLDYHFTFRDTPERAERARAALDLAVSIAYRYLAAWAADNDKTDNEDPTFLMEPNSGQNWAGAPCANEVAWFLDVLAQVYVHSGDARLGYMLRGALDRWNLLYRDMEKPSLADYGRDAFTEGWGVYSGCGPGAGIRYDYGWANDLLYAWPISNAVARVVCGDRAALACVKTAERFDVTDYRSGGASAGDFSFRVASERKKPFDIALSYPQVNLAAKKVVVQRGSERLDGDVRRPPQAPASLYIRGLRDGDTVVVGEPKADAPPLAIARLLEQEPLPEAGRGKNGEFLMKLGPVSGDTGEFELLPLESDTKLTADWTKLDSWAGLPSGLRWAFGVPFWLTPMSAADGRIARRAPVKFLHGIEGPATLFLAYAATHKDAWFSLAMDNGTSTIVNAEPSIAWQPWPPVFKQRLLLASMNIPALRSVERISSRNALLVALTLHHGDPKTLPVTTAAVNAGIEAWRTEQKAHAEMDSLRTEVEKLPAGRIALLPTDPRGPARRFASRCGLLEKTDALTPEQMVEPGRLDASRYPVALNLGGERYPFSVRADGDGRAALVNYLKSGGLIICLCREPFPFYYGEDLRDPKHAEVNSAQPLLPQLGVTLKNIFEKPPEGHTFRFDHIVSQRVLPNAPWQLIFPTNGDLRLRTISDEGMDRHVVRYHTLYAVSDERSNDHGDAAAYIEWTNGDLAGGKLLYVWSGLQLDPYNSPMLLHSIFRFAIEHAKKTK